MKNKKGFTLVEVLAVIIVLALLFVIATPKILDAIENSEKNAFKNNVENLIKTAEMEYQNNGGTDEINYIFPESDLNVNGDKPSSGTISIELDENNNFIGTVVDKLVSSNGKWCASKRMFDKEAVIAKVVDGYCYVNFFKVGDYVQMLPDTSSVTIVGSSSFKSGSGTYSSGEVGTINLNPGNIDLWRIIKINDDNTVDAVSEYVTDEIGNFSGQVGYYYYSTRLRWVANDFSSKNFVQKTRYMNNADAQVVKSVYGTLKATTKDGTYSPYYIDEKYIGDYYQGYYYAKYKYVNTSGTITTGTLARGTSSKDIRYFTQSASSIEGHFRPILTLVPNLNATSGDGSKEYPYELVIEEE